MLEKSSEKMIFSQVINKWLWVRCKLATMVYRDNVGATWR